MNSLYIIKIINRLAIIFSIFNFVLSALMRYEKSNGLLFVWLCGTAITLTILKRHKKKYFFLLIPALFFPVVTVSSVEEFIYIAAFCICASYIGVRETGEMNYDNELDFFIKGVYVTAGLSAAALVIGLGFLSSFSAQFILIYLVSSVILLRTLRVIKLNKDSREAAKLNNRYSFLIIAFSFIFSTSYIRDLIINGIEFVYHYLTTAFMYVFSWLFIGIGYVLAIAFNALMELLRKLAGNHLQSLQLSNNDTNKPLNIKNSRALIDNLINNRFFSIGVKIIVIVLVIYMIVKLLKHFASSSEEEEGFEEEKEFIEGDKRDSEGILRKAINFLKPKSEREQIRLYYQKFMKLGMDRDVEIRDNDTTLDINKKSEKIFNKSVIEEIRNIYIKIRYGNKECDRETVKNMGKSYNSLKKF